MKICIVDDEAECSEALQSLLNEYVTARGLDLEIDTFSDSASFLAVFHPDTYSLIFLDIFIDDMTGLEIAQQIRQQSDRCMLVFCTTSLDSMAGAFSTHAYDYIVKPVTAERVTKLMDDALRVLPKIERYLTFTCNRQEVRLFLSDCVSVTTSGHYLDITDRNDNVYRTRLTLSELREMTKSDERFLLINKGIVVNMDYIRTIEERICVLSNGEQFPIKVRESAEIAKQWQDYCFAQIREAHQ